MRDEVEEIWESFFSEKNNKSCRQLIQNIAMYFIYFSELSALSRSSRQKVILRANVISFRAILFSLQVQLMYILQLDVSIKFVFKIIIKLCF